MLIIIVNGLGNYIGLSFIRNLAKDLDAHPYIEIKQHFTQRLNLNIIQRKY